MSPKQAKALIDLVRLLAELYPSKRRAEILATEATLNTTEIDLSDPPLERWWSIVAYAYSRGKLGRLIIVVLQDPSLGRENRVKIAGWQKVLQKASSQASRRAGHTLTEQRLVRISPGGRVTAFEHLIDSMGPEVRVALKEGSKGEWTVTIEKPAWYTYVLTLAVLAVFGVAIVSHCQPPPLPPPWPAIVRIAGDRRDVVVKVSVETCSETGTSSGQPVKVLVAPECDSPGPMLPVLVKADGFEGVSLEAPREQLRAQSGFTVLWKPERTLAHLLGEVETAEGAPAGGANVIMECGDPAKYPVASAESDGSFKIEFARACDRAPQNLRDHPVRLRAQWRGLEATRETAQTHKIRIVLPPRPPPPPPSCKVEWLRLHFRDFREYCAPGFPADTVGPCARASGGGPGALVSVNGKSATFQVDAKACGCPIKDEIYQNCPKAATQSGPH